MSDILSSIIARRTLGGEIFNVPVGSEIPVVIGLSRGANTAVASPEAITHDASRIDTLANTPIRTVVWVNTLVDGSGRGYTENVHFTAQSSGSLDWSNAPALAPPAMDSATLVESGGSWSASGDVAWAVTCTDADGNETTVGSYVKSEVTDITHSFTLKFAKPAGASGSCKIYRTFQFDSDGEPIFTSGTVVYFSTALTTFTDTGAAGTSGTSPATNTAKDRPGIGTTYYVNYEYAVFSYQSPKLYDNIDAIITDHGIGSDLTNAGILAIGRNGKGNESPAVVLVAVENDDVSDYQDALTALEDYPFGNYIVCLKQNDILDQSGKSHAEAMSADAIKKERFYVTAARAGASPGDASTPGTVIYQIGQFLGSKRVVVTTLEGGVFTLNQLQGTDGEFTYNVALTNSQFFAVAVAARKCAMPDPAEDLTGKQIIGFNMPNGNPHWSTLVKEKVVTAGGFLAVDEAGQVVVNRAITTSTASVQDQTLSILSAEDELRRQVRASGEPFIGKKITEARLAAFKSFVKQVLDGLIQNEIIDSYQDLETFQDTTNPQMLRARFLYQVVYSSIWIRFDYGFIPVAG